MATERIRLKSVRGAGTLETILDSLRDYTFQVEDMSRLAERQRTRMIFIGYLLVSFVLIATLLAKYMISRVVGADEQWLYFIFAAFGVVTLFGLPTNIGVAVTRYREYRNELNRAVNMLEETMRFASQIKDHVELDRLEEMLLHLRLKEADATLEHARRAAKAK